MIWLSSNILKTWNSYNNFWIQEKNQEKKSKRKRGYCPQVLRVGGTWENKKKMKNRSTCSRYTQISSRCKKGEEKLIKKGMTLMLHLILTTRNSNCRNKSCVSSLKWLHSASSKKKEEFFYLCKRSKNPWKVRSLFPAELKCWNQDRAS